MPACEPCRGRDGIAPDKLLTDHGTTATVVMGVGNLLREDDGVGVHVARALMGRDDLGSVTVLDGGVSPLDALAGLGTIQRLIIVDAADLSERPGAIRVLTSEELASRAGQSMSLHDLDLAWALSVLEATGEAPCEVKIIGVQPASLEWRTELSPVLQGRFDDIVAAVIAEIPAQKSERKRVRT